MKFQVYDTEGYPMGKPFNSYLDAMNYKSMKQRPDWTIEIV